MRSILGVLMLCFAGFSVQAQGILFNQGTFEEAKQKAIKEGKPIFVDFHTVWCAPCKALSKKVFPQPEVGKFFNASFVSIKLDAEKEGKELAKRYNVTAFPTLLFLNTKGEVLNKLVGAVTAKTLIEGGKMALLAANDTYSYSNLKKDYAAKRNDENFLLKYIEKMVEFKESPVAEIEEFLKMQTQLKERDVDMMEFLLKYQSHLICGGKAEQIFNQNIDEYMDIATKREAEQLKSMSKSMLRETKQYALLKNDTTLFKLFIQRWVASPEKAYFEDYNDFRLDLLRMQGNTQAYQQLAVRYLDSIITIKPATEVQQGDKARYEKFLKDHKGQGGMMYDAQRQSMVNLDAEIQTKAILKVGGQFLSNINDKADTKPIYRWIEYGKRLMPNDYRMSNFEAKVLYKFGSKDDAIAAKKRALELMDPNDKVRKEVEVELAKWQTEKQ